MEDKCCAGEDSPASIYWYSCCCLRMSETLNHSSLEQSSCCSYSPIIVCNLPLPFFHTPALSILVWALMLRRPRLTSPASLLHRSSCPCCVFWYSSCFTQRWPSLTSLSALCGLLAQVPRHLYASLFGDVHVYSQGLDAHLKAHLGTSRVCVLCEDTRSQCLQYVQGEGGRNLCCHAGALGPMKTN